MTRPTSRWPRSIALCAGLAACAPTALLAADAPSPFEIAHQVTRSITADPSIAPDGRRMVYLTVVAGMEQLFTANVDGGDVRQITHDAFDHEDPAGSPDGRRIAFASNRRGNQQIFVMDADGSHVLPVIHREGRATAPRWTPDGQALYFPVCSKTDGVVGCEILSARLRAP